MVKEAVATANVWRLYNTGRFVKLCYLCFTRNLPGLTLGLSTHSSRRHSVTEPTSCLFWNIFILLSLPLIFLRAKVLHYIPSYFHMSDRSSFHTLRRLLLIFLTVMFLNCIRRILLPYRSLDILFLIRFPSFGLLLSIRSVKFNVNI